MGYRERNHTGASNGDDSIERVSTNDRFFNDSGIERRKNTYFGEYTRDDESPSLVVVEMVASIAEADPMDLPPLYDVVDPDVLDAFCSSRTSKDLRRHVSFEYEGFEVTVYCSGLIELAPLR